MVTPALLERIRNHDVESCRIQLESPLLRIGDAEGELSPFQFVQTNSYIYLPNQEALARELQQRARLDDFVTAIERRENLTTFLKQAFGNDWRDLVSDKKSPVFPASGHIPKWVQGNISTFRPMIRNGFGQQYIPGSSIKGAIRTAITYHLLKNSTDCRVPDNLQVDALEARTKATLKRIAEIDERNQRQNQGDKLSENKKKSMLSSSKEFHKLFSDSSLKHPNGKSDPEKNAAKTDFMRLIHISDSNPLRKIAENGKVMNEAAATEIVISSRYDTGKAKYKSSLFAECVVNVKTQFTLSIDQRLLKHFKQQGIQIPFKTVDDVLRICQEFAQEQWGEERFYWEGIQDNPKTNEKLRFSHIRDFYNLNDCPDSLRIGWGSGLLGTTIGLALEAEVVEGIRDACGFMAPNFEAPKSRRTVINGSGEIEYVPGWTKFTRLA